MTPNHVTKLITTAKLERPVQYFGPDAGMLARVSRTWLEAHGRPGDKFEVFEIKEVLVRTVEITAVTVSQGLVVADVIVTQKAESSSPAEPIEKQAADKLVTRAGNLDCPACNEKRLHDPREFKAFHPHAGHGISKPHGSPVDTEAKKEAE